MFWEKKITESENQEVLKSTQAVHSLDISRILVPG